MFFSKFCGIVKNKLFLDHLQWLRDTEYLFVFSSTAGVSLRIQFECCKLRTRITPNTDNFYAVENIFPRTIQDINFNNSQTSLQRTPTVPEKLSAIRRCPLCRVLGFSKKRQAFYYTLRQLW